MEKYKIEENFYNMTGENVEATKTEEVKYLHSAITFMEEVKNSYLKKGFMIEDDSAEECGFFVNYKDGCTHSHIRVKVVIEMYI